MGTSDGARRRGQAGGAPRLGRRDLLTRVVPLGALTLAAAACGERPAPSRPTAAGRAGRPLALVYRGGAGCPGCSEPVATLLESAPRPFRTVYCGPGEEVPITPETLSAAALYAQPGGGNDLEAAWSAMRPYAGAIRDFVGAGGHYLGICMGGYLAGFDPGFNLLPGDSGEWITSAGATVHSNDDAMVTVSWRGRPRSIYFQDGPYFTVRPDSGATVLATYSNGLAAAVVARYKKGSVGVSGPHPEAPASWYRESGLVDPDGVHLDLGYDLVDTTMRA
ncbi:MAG: BPL-N domain-containing protein [Acidimicrobiales bacterium]